MRPDWDTYFLEIARVVATRATCLRRKCGVVLVRDHRLLATGYNGAPPGQLQCDEVGCEMEDGHCVRTTHAEVNAVAHAARYGVPIAGATVYIAGGTPCRCCANILLATDVTRIVCDQSYPDERALTVLQVAGVSVEILTSASIPS